MLWCQWCSAAPEWTLCAWWPSVKVDLCKITTRHSFNFSMYWSTILWEHGLLFVYKNTHYTCIILCYNTPLFEMTLTTSIRVRRDYNIYVIFIYISFFSFIVSSTLHDKWKIMTKWSKKDEWRCVHIILTTLYSFVFFWFVGILFMYIHLIQMLYSSLGILIYCL